jgi:hypothetical protein
MRAAVWILLLVTMALCTTSGAARVLRIRLRWTSRGAPMVCSFRCRTRATV